MGRTGSPARRAVVLLGALVLGPVASRADDPVSIEQVRAGRPTSGRAAAPIQESDYLLGGQGLIQSLPAAQALGGAASRASVSQVGSGNTGSIDMSGFGNTANQTVNGNRNNISQQQSGSYNSSSVTVSGDANTVGTKQDGSGGAVNIVVRGDGNAITSQQQGSGGPPISITQVGNGGSVSVSRR